MIVRSDKAVGCVGVVVRRGGRRYLTTAAHVARTPGATLEVVGLGRVRVVDLRWDEHHDIALLEPAIALPDSACRLPDHTRLTGLGRAPIVGRPAFAYRAGASHVSRTTITGVGSHRPIQGPNELPMNIGPLIATHEFTIDGDSGALLFDSVLGALGTLVGEHHKESVFLSLAPMLQSLSATLET
ncbi:hypothetical protein ACNOYE_03865 [Nannocystaceae bacterium ST9]